tara:strand:- start:414 stop:1331 length:918 start_codon:yes stop_codon:yes gene_type:complete
MKNKSLLKFSTLALGAASIALMAGCSYLGNPMREQVAERVAGQAWLLKREIAAYPYMLTAYERMHETHAPVTIYIEGDGMANKHQGTILYQPDPKNPVGLHLASKDRSKNLAYIARPCQYSGLIEETEEKNCKQEETWNTALYSRKTLNAYNSAIDKMKRRYDLTEINLVGYDSGATLAAMIAGSREDVASFRTVAGEFQIDVIEPYARQLSLIPQYHFIGGDDEFNQPGPLHAYLQMVDGNHCVYDTLIQEAGHDNGWVDKWPDLHKKELPTCEAPMKELDYIPYEIEPKPEPIYYPRPSSLAK